MVTVGTGFVGVGNGKDHQQPVCHTADDVHDQLPGVRRAPPFEEEKVLVRITLPKHF